MGKQSDAGSRRAASGGYSTQLIDGQGKFNRSGLESFTEKAELSQSGTYMVISIMGPQSSGKSTLLNHMYQTNFTEMNAHKGRSQTTLGAWLAKCVNVEPCTLVLDLEGNDGRERGDDDTSFEKQLALFALAVSDIVLINMWCHDVGREKAANKPLLRTAFQVMMRLFKPRKTTLLFVLRDKTQTPFSKLEQILKEDTLKIWDSIAKPQSHKKTDFTEFFSIKVVALPNYEEEMEEFMEEVIELRERISRGEMSSAELVPALGFSISAENIWNTIRDNKDLNIPPPSVMIAKVRCEEIAREKLEAFLANDKWCKLSEAMSSNPMQDFGKKTSTLIDACLQDYDEDAQIYKDDIRKERREMLLENLLLRIKPVYDSALQAIMKEKVKEFQDAFYNDLKEDGRKRFRDVVDKCMKSYSTQFDEAFKDIMIPQAADNWECSSDKEKFVNEMNEIVAQSRRGKLNELIHEYKERLREGANEPLDMILGNPGPQTWPSIRKLLETQSRDIGKEYYEAMSELGAEEEGSIEQIQTQFRGYFRELVVSKAKTETMKLTSLMQDKFTTMFLQDSNSMPRAWDEDDVQIEKIIRVAKIQCLKMLSAMVAIRLEGDDDIEDTLRRALMGGGGDGDDEEDDRPSYGALAMTTWIGISKEDTLISPIKCASMWKQFLTKTNQITTLVKKTIKQAKREAEDKQVPPPPALDLFGLIGSVVKAIIPEIVPILNAIGATANAVNQIQVQQAKHKSDMAQLKEKKEKKDGTRK